MMGNTMFNIIKKIRYAIFEKGSILENELMWASLWREASRGIDWLKNEQLMLFPGRWAIGYNTMYILARSLNAVKPQNVLELGLGNSTQIITAYFKNIKSKQVSHIIVEHDKDWVKFYKNENVLLDTSEICVCPMHKQNYKSVRNIWCYDGFQSCVSGKQYGLILIDGPHGSDAKFSRIDILNIMPENLNDSFVVIVDDYDRVGEKNMVKELESLLQRNHISYKKGVYPGEKECCVIVSEDNAFLTSL